METKYQVLHAASIRLSGAEDFFTPFRVLDVAEVGGASAASASRRT